MNATHKYKCPQCGEEHDFVKDAIECCAIPEVWYCDCGQSYSNENAAEECCHGKN